MLVRVPVLQHIMQAERVEPQLYRVVLHLPIALILLHPLEVVNKFVQDQRYQIAFVEYQVNHIVIQLNNVRVIHAQYQHQIVLQHIKQVVHVEPQLHRLVVLQLIAKIRMQQLEYAYLNVLAIPAQFVCVVQLILLRIVILFLQLAHLLNINLFSINLFF